MGISIWVTRMDTKHRRRCTLTWLLRVMNIFTHFNKKKKEAKKKKVTTIILILKYSV